MATFTEHDLLQSLVDTTDIMFFWKDSERRFRGASKSFLDYYGFSSLEDIWGKTDEDMGWHIDPDPYRNDESIVIRTGKSILNSEGKCIIRGKVRHILASKFPIRNAAGELSGLVGYFRDITETAEKDKEKNSPMVDKLTGLNNRKGLDEAAKEYIFEYENKGTDFVLMFLDINKFANINDAFGHIVGDIYLVLVAKELLKAAGKNSVVARYEHDQFVILSQTSAQKNEDEYILSMISQIRSLQDENQYVESYPVHTGLSIGYVHYSETENYEESLTLAQKRMFEDKTSY